MSKKNINEHKFWSIFRAPETVIAFLSGALLSAAINIITSEMVRLWYNIVASVLMIVASLILVIWTVIVEPIKNEFKKERDDQSWRLSSFWYEKLISHKNAKRWLLSCFIFVIVLFVLSLLFLIVPNFL